MRFLNDSIGIEHILLKITEHGLFFRHGMLFSSNMIDDSLYEQTKDLFLPTARRRSFVCYPCYRCMLQLELDIEDSGMLHNIIAIPFIYTSSSYCLLLRLQNTT